MTKVLGLDLGPNSIGWALIEIDDEKIIGSGVRIFQEGIDKKKRIPRNAERRAARLIRRQYFRRANRKEQLAEALQDIGLFPDNETELKDFFKIEPYEMRRKGLDEKLTPFEFGRALYHIDQRRGFKSNRKTLSKEDGAIFEGKEGVKGITETEKAIRKGGFRTLGEYLASLDPKHERRRNRYTLRSMYIDEFNKLWDKQHSYYSDFLEDVEKERIFDIIFFQRKLKSQKHTVGRCTFEPKKRCAPISSPTFQYYRILEQLCRIRLTNEERHDSQLTDEERELLISELNIKEKIKLDRMKKLLNLPPETYINLEYQEKLLGNTTAWKLIKVFGKKRCVEMSADETEKIWHTLHFSDNEDWLVEYAKENWGLEGKGIENLKKISLEKGYGRLSRKAMLNIIPHLEKGMTYDKAAEKAGYHHSKLDLDMEIRTKLPEPEDLRNPIVRQALYELRRLVNALIEEYGHPDIIRVELAREMKLPKKRRDRLAAENKKRKNKAEEIREMLRKDLGFKSPSREDVHKYLLWEECGNTCPYTGKKISLTALFRGDFDIEHIIPYSRSLNDSLYNRTLCHNVENREIKHNLTPYEAYSGNEKKYNVILERVKKNMPHKLRLFTQKEIDEDFVTRQLVDTAYISREVLKYVKHICKKVQVNKGGITATLRWLWGLNEILSKHIDVKNREDHRHHAIDAIVIALTTPHFVHKMSSYHKYDREPKRDKFPEPWKTFRTDAEKSVNAILVSHRVNKRVRGKLHQETYYGSIIQPDGTPSYVVRKPLASLTANGVKSLVDPVIRTIVLGRLQTLGVDTESRFSIPKDAFTEKLFMPGTDTQIKSVRISVQASNMIQLHSGKKTFVEPGNNHHMVIFEDENGRRTGKVVSLFDAAARFKKGMPVIDKTPPQAGMRFAMSLAINELLLLDVEENLIDWKKPPSAESLSTQLFRVQKMDMNGRIILRHHTAAILKDEEGKEPGMERKSIGTLRGIKVETDPLGKLSLTND